MFEDCPRAWYKKYIDGYTEKAGNAYSDFGSFCHSLLEKYIKGEYKKEQLLEVYEDTFFDEIQSFSIGKNDPLDKLYDYGYDYFSNVNIDTKVMKPIYVEENIEFNLGKHKFRGIIDFMYEDENGDVVILDHKTSEYPISQKGTIKKSKESVMLGYQRQLGIYTIGVLQLQKYKPKYIGWNFIRGGKIYKIPITPEILEDAKTWGLDVIDRIYNEESFAKNKQYFMCSTLCDFRNDC